MRKEKFIRNYKLYSTHVSNFCFFLCMQLSLCFFITKNMLFLMLRLFHSANQWWCYSVAPTFKGRGVRMILFYYIYRFVLSDDQVSIKTLEIVHLNCLSSKKWRLTCRVRDKCWPNEKKLSWKIWIWVYFNLSYWIIKF